MSVQSHARPTPIEGHTAKAFDAALAELRLHIVGMGGLVIDQVSTAVRALLDGDAALAQTVLSREAAGQRAGAHGRSRSVSS